MGQTVVLSEKRKGEIAYAMVFEDQKRKKHSLLRTEILKKIGQISKTLLPLKISKDEVIFLYQEIIYKLVESSFGPKYFEKRDPNKPWPLSQERKGEIALQLWKIDIKEKSFSFEKNDFDRKIGNVMQALNGYEIGKDEVLSLYQELLQETMQELFS